MKKLSAYFLSVTVLLFVVFSGCVKSSDNSTNPITAIPDVANFLLNSSLAFVAGSAATIHLSSTSLGDGTFTIGYNITGHNAATGLTATLNMSGGAGSFSTPALSDDGPTSVTVTSITNSKGGVASITSNNVSSLFDSTGQMTATFTPAVGSAKSFHATDLKATLTGSMLNIHGVVWEPDLSTINLTLNYYTGTAGTTSFNFMDASSLNGNASYGFSGTPTISEVSQHGSVTISTTSPLLTGSFTYTNTDSSKVVGTFSCAAP